MPLFARRTYIEPGATMPLEVHLPKGMILGVADGQGSVPGLQIWQAVRAEGPMGDAPSHRHHVWVLRNGSRIPAPPVSADGWAFKGIVHHNHQPSLVLIVDLGSAEPPRPTEEVMSSEDMLDSVRALRPPPVPDPFKPTGDHEETRQFWDPNYHPPRGASRMGRDATRPGGV